MNKLHARYVGFGSVGPNSAATSDGVCGILVGAVRSVMVACLGVGDFLEVEVGWRGLVAEVTGHGYTGRVVLSKVGIAYLDKATDQFDCQKAVGYEEGRLERSGWRC